MKLGIPSLGDRGLEELVGEHFGRVPFYTIVDTETESVTVVPNTSEHMGGRGYPPELLSQAGVDIMLCRGLGRRAVMMFEEMGIQVFVGVDGTISNAVDQWREGRLEMATDENACSQHAFRQHDHGEHHHHGQRD